MSRTASSPPSYGGSTRGLLVLFACLVVVLFVLFSSSFKPEQALFANDGPLGAQASAIYKLPTAFFGIWNDQYWVGAYNGNYSPNFTGVLLWLLRPIWFNKLYVPLAQLILGLSAGYFFSKLKFQPAVCVLGGLAAALNMNFFSNACWGLATRSLSLAATFLALTALQIGISQRSGLRCFLLTVLAGLGVGMSISEGADNGAIFSLFVGAYGFCQYLFQEGSITTRLVKGAGRVLVMVLFAALLAAQTLNVFVKTSVIGVVGTEQDRETKASKWNFNTQWSLPKLETLRAIIPGLFGYRLDTPNGGNYWGHVGRDPAFEKTGQGFPRHSGAGEYAGVLVVLIGVWAVASSLRRKESPFSDPEKKMIWFWSVAALAALGLGWGRHAPFYWLLYKLPYFSTIRNPMKFMHPFHLCLLILFAYGLQGLWRRHVEVTSAIKKQPFEKKWMLGSVAAVGIVILGFLVYAASSDSLVRVLMADGFNDAAFARQMARFSVNEAMYFAFFLTISVVAVLLIQRGLFSGPKAKWAGLFLGLILVVDLARADAPWIKYYNYREKYATNPVLETLAVKPHEGRVAMALSMCVSAEQFELIQKIYPFTRNWTLLQQVYQIEWLQHHFPFYNIQSLDQPQEPRPPADKTAYRTALAGKMARLYELTNTRYICGMSGNFADALNQMFDPQQRRFRVHTPFNFVQVGDEGIGVQANPAGQFALIEFTGALPRAKLYSRWQVSTNEQATLTTLADAAFDPAQNVIVADQAPSPPANTTASPKLSTEIVSYSPKRIELRTESPLPAVLLVNNKWDEGWKVAVDGKPARLLRCNFLMQGVYLPANSKTVVLRFEPNSTIFFISLTAVVFGLVLCVLLAVTEDRRKDFAPRPDSPASSPATNQKTKS